MRYDGDGIIFIVIGYGYAGMVRDNKGQAMIEFVLLLPLTILLFMGAIDISFTILNKIQIQQAAYNASLAAADVLPDIATAETKAIEFAKANGAKDGEIQTIINQDQATVIITREGMVFTASFREEPFYITGKATCPAY